MYININKRTQVELLVQMRARVTALEDDKQRLEDDKQRLQAEAQRLHAEAEEGKRRLQEELRRLQAELRRLHDDLGHWRARSDVASHELEHTRFHIVALETKERELLCLLQARVSQCTTLGHELERFQVQVGGLQKELDESAEIVQSQQLQAHSYRTQSALVQADLRHLTHQLELLRGDVGKEVADIGQLCRCSHQLHCGQFQQDEALDLLDAKVRGLLSSVTMAYQASQERAAAASRSAQRQRHRLSHLQPPSPTNMAHEVQQQLRDKDCEISGLLARAELAEESLDFTLQSLAAERKALRVQAELVAETDLQRRRENDVVKHVQSEIAERDYQLSLARERELVLRSSAAAATAAQKVLEEQVEASMAHTAQQLACYEDERCSCEAEIQALRDAYSQSSAALMLSQDQCQVLELQAQDAETALWKGQVQMEQEARKAAVLAQALQTTNEELRSESEHVREVEDKMWLSVHALEAAQTELQRNRLRSNRGLERATFAVFSRWSQIKISSLFLFWADHCSGRHMLKRTGQRVMGRMNHYKAHAAVASWKEHGAEQHRRRLVSSRMLSRWLNQALALSLACWREQSREQARLRRVCGKVLARRMVAKLAFVLDAWCEKATEFKRQRHVLRQTVQRMRHSAVLNAHATWLINTKEIRRQRGVLETMSRMSRRFIYARAFRAFCTWSFNVKELRQQSGLLERVRIRVKHAGIYSAYVTWADNVKELQRQRGVLERVVLRMKNALAYQACMTWANNVKECEELQHQTGVLERVALRMRRQKIRMRFASWADKVASDQRLRRVANKIMQRWNQKDLAVPFESWAVNAAARLRVRHGAQAMVTRWANLRLAAPFESWALYVQAKGRERVELDRVLDQRHLLV
jgi:hypothetical protein